MNEGIYSGFDEILLYEFPFDMRHSDTSAPPVQLAQPGVNYGEPTPGFCFSGRIAQGLSQKGKIGAELQPTVGSSAELNSAQRSGLYISDILFLIYKHAVS